MRGICNSFWWKFSTYYVAAWNVLSYYTVGSQIHEKRKEAKKKLKSIKLTTYSIVPRFPLLCPLRVLNAIPILLIPQRFVKMNFLYFVDGMMSASRGGLKSPLYAFVKYMHTHSIDHLKLFHAKHQSLWQFKALYHMLCRIDCVYICHLVWLWVVCWMK